MAIIAAPDGSYYSDKTGKTYTREQILAKVEEKKAKEGQSFFERAADMAGSLFSGETTTYEQTGALQHTIQGDSGFENSIMARTKSLFDANNVLETDSDRAARLREASDILGLNELDSSKIMRGGLDDDGVMKSALALAKKKQSEPDDWEQFAAEHPATIKYLEQQKNMAISYDDVKPLGRLEDTANTVKAHLEMMDLEEKIAELGRKYDAQNMSYNDLSADQRVELQDLINRRKEIAGTIDTWSVGNVLGSLLVMKEDIPMALGIGLQAALVGAGAGALAGGIGAIPGAVTGFSAGFRIGMGTSMGYRMAGTQYAENMMRADANGQYMDANSLRQGAWGAGIGMTALGAFGVGRLTEKLPMGQIYDKFLRTTSPSVLNNPAAREAAWKGYLSTLGTGVKEAAIQDVIFGGGTAALTFGANRYSEAWSGLDYSNREDGTLIDNIINGMEQFAPLALGTGVGFTMGGKLAGKALSSKKPYESPPMPVADGLNKVMNAVDETKTAQRSPQATRDMINTVFGETASSQDVEINAQGLVRLFQEADPDNPNKVVEVAQRLGVDEKTLNEAVELGGDIRVSVGDFVKEFGLDKDSKNLRAEVLKEVRDVDGMTENSRGEVLSDAQRQMDAFKEWLQEQKNAQYDHNDPAYIAAMESAKAAYPNQPKNMEQQANIIYAGFKRMEEMGTLKLLGFENAEQAIRAVEVRRKEAPDEQSDGLNQAAMYRSKRATNFVEFSQEAKDIKAAHTEKTDKPYLRFIGSEGSEIDIARDDMFHAVNKHNLTDEQLQAIETNAENFVSVYEDTGKKGGRGGTVVLAKVDTPLGRAGVAYEIMPNGRTFLNTMFFDDEAKIDNWQQNKKGGSSKIILDKSKTSTAGNTPSSISSIKQALGIVNKAKDERAASDVVNDTMQLLQSAWVGSPADFDKFDLGYVGTGEGAQVHGYGLYSAADRKVAERYKEVLSSVKSDNYIMLGDKRVPAYGFVNGLTTAETMAYRNIQRFGYDKDKAVAHLREYLKEQDENDDIALVKEAIAVAEKAEVHYNENKGKLYEVEIPDNDVLLDEQKPFEEQPEKVKKALEKYGEQETTHRRVELDGKTYQEYKDGWHLMDDVEAEDGGYPVEKASQEIVERIESLPESAFTERHDKWQSLAGVPGERIYQRIVEDKGSPKAASEYLNSIGIKGITYEGGMDGRCYVVFDDKAMSIINKYNQEHGTTGGETLASYTPQEAGRAIIELYKNANPSSLAHEMLHHWVTLNEVAFKTGKMEGQALEDFQKLAEFAGHELGTEWSREEHEKLASAWETYLSEGRAPSLELVGTFDRFKQWMKKIYETLVRHAVPINDDVRGVFDRMLAADKELALAEDFYMHEELFAGREMNETAKREYIGMLMASHDEAQKEMDKRVMAEVKPAMKEIEGEVAKNLREDIAGQMMNEPVYVARSLLTAPVDSPDFKAAKAKTIREKLDERLDLLVKESAKGVENKGMIAENARQVSQEWFGGFSNNHDWYKDMFARRGDKIPGSWYRFIKGYKEGTKTLKQMPKTMREEYEYIANEQLTNGHKDSFYGDIPEDMEYVNLKDGTPAMSFIVQNGGGIRLDRASVYERYGKGALQERWLTDKNGYTLDELADYVFEGKAGGDKLFEELTTKPTFAKELAKRVRAGLTEFKDNELGTLRESAIKAIYNEKSMDAVALRAEVFERMAAEKKAKEQQKTADAMAEGREKAKTQEKIDKAVSKAEEKAANKAAREQRHIDAMISRGTLKAKAAREMARQQIVETPVGEVMKWQKYTALANRARKESIRAMSKGDYEAALEATNRELLCHAMAKAAADADKALKSTMNYFGRINRRGLKMNKVPHAFNVQIDNLLAKYNLLTREPLKPLEGDSAPQLSQFIKDCEENYFVPVVSEDIVNGQPMHYTRLTFQQMQDLKQGVKSLQHVGRQMDATVANAKKQSITDICQSLVEQLATHAKRYALQGEMGQADVPTVSMTSLVKAETLLRLMDKGEENGVFVRNLYNPIKLGLDDYANRSRKIVTDWDKVLADSGWTAKELYKQKNVEHTFDFMPNPKVSHEQVILSALNWGNEGNRDRLRYYFMTPEQRRMKAFTPEQLAEIDGKVMQMFEVLTAKDLKLIQAVWDYLETYAPEIRKHEVEVAGVDVKMVEPTAFTVMSADGQSVQMRGGYFPIRYDSGRSTRALDLEQANQLYKQNSAVTASTAHGHVKARTQHMNRPLLLEWNTLLDHLRNVNYDLAMRKPIMDVSRILRNEDVQSAIAETFGNEKVKMLQDWVRDIATDQREDKLTFAENAMRWTRTRMSVAYLGFRTKALVIDLPQNFITSVWQNGLDETIKGISQFYLTGDYRQKLEFMNARSPMMRDKISFMDANLADLRVSMLDQSKTAQYTRMVQKLAFCCDLFADMAVNAPMWLRFHAEAMKRGLTDAEASLEADAKTRRMSVDTSKAGMAAIQRGGEFKKLVTPFYSYFNAFFNRLYFDYGMARIKAADGQQMDAARLMVRTAVLGVGIPTMIEAIMQGMLINNDKQKDKKKHGEDMMKEAASASFSYLANTVPLAGGVASLAFDKAIGKNYKNYEFSPVEAALTDFASVPANIINYVSKKDTDKEAGEKLARSLSRAAAVAVPYPNMINTLALNIWDVISKGDFTLSDLVTRRRNAK